MSLFLQHSPVTASCQVHKVELRDLLASSTRKSFEWNKQNVRVNHEINKHEIFLKIARKHFDNHRDNTGEVGLATVNAASSASHHR